MFFQFLKQDGLCGVIHHGLFCCKFGLLTLFFLYYFFGGSGVRPVVQRNRTTIDMFL